jgi:hypothetical protein
MRMTMRGLSTSRAARVRNKIKPISRARRGKCWVTLLVRSPDVDDMSPLFFRMIVRAPPPLPSATPRDRVEVVIPVRHRTFSRTSTPSLMLLPLLLIGRSSLPPPSPLSFFPPASLSPAAVPNPAIVPNPAAVRRSSRPRRPVLPPTPSTSTPSTSAGIKIVDLALGATKRVHGIDNIVCSLVIETRPPAW